MVLENLGAEHVAVDVHVDFGGAYAFVAEHSLNGTEVGSTFEQVGGKAVAEGVGTDGWADTCAQAELFDDMEDGDARQRGAAAQAEEDEIFVAWFGLEKVALLEP